MQLTVMSYNIRHCMGTDWRVNVDRIAQVISGIDPDVVCLQEVYEWRSKREKWQQASSLSRMLGMQLSFEASVNLGFGAWGNAVLTKRTILDSNVYQLPSLGEPRIAQQVQVRTKRTDICVINTHLGFFRFERKGQIRRLVKKIPSNIPMIICGDFNTNESELRSEMIGFKPVFTGTPTYPSKHPKRVLDNIWISSEFAVANTEVLRSNASDHAAIVARLII